MADSDRHRSRRSSRYDDYPPSNDGSVRYVYRTTRRGAKSPEPEDRDYDRGYNRERSHGSRRDRDRGYESQRERDRDYENQRDRDISRRDRDFDPSPRPKAYPPITRAARPDVQRRRSRSADVNYQKGAAADYYSSQPLRVSPEDQQLQRYNPERGLVKSRRRSDSDDDRGRSSRRERRKRSSKSRSKSRVAEFAAAVVGAAALIGGKEAYDRKEGKPNQYKKEPLETTALGAIGALASYEAVKAINRHRERKEDDGSDSDDENHKGRHLAELGLGAAGAGVAANEYKKHHKRSGSVPAKMNPNIMNINWEEWQKKMQGINVDSKYQHAAKAAMTAAALEAWKAHKDGSPLTGAKGMKIAQAAFLAGRQDALKKGKKSDGDKKGEGGEKGEKGEKSEKGGLGALGDVATLGIATAAGKKLYSMYKEKHDKSDSKSGKSKSKAGSGYNSGDDSDNPGSGGKKKRRKSVTDFASAALGAVGLEEIAKKFDKSDKEKSDSKGGSKSRKGSPDSRSAKDSREGNRDARSARNRQDSDDSDRSRQATRRRRGSNDSDRSRQAARGRRGSDDSDQSRQANRGRRGSNDSDRSRRASRNQRGNNDSDRSQRSRSRGPNGFAVPPDQRPYSDDYAQHNSRPLNEYADRNNTAGNGYYEQDYANPYSPRESSRGAIVPSPGQGDGQLVKAPQEDDNVERGFSHSRPNYGNGDSSGDSDSSPWDSEVSSSEEERRLKKTKRKQIFAATLAAAAALQAANGMYEAKEKRDERLKECKEKGGVDSAKYKALKTKANLRNIGTVGLAVWGLKEAGEAVSGIKKVHDEKRNLAENYKRHHEIRERRKQRSLAKGQKTSNGTEAPEPVPVAPPVDTGYNPKYDPKYDLKGEPGTRRDEWGYQSEPGANGVAEPQPGDRGYAGSKGSRGMIANGYESDSESDSNNKDKQNGHGRRRRYHHRDGTVDSHKHRNRRASVSSKSYASTEQNSRRHQRRGSN